MTYLFSSNSVITNEVEIKNDTGNAISTTVSSNGVVVSTTHPFPVTLGSDTITITGNVNVSTVVQVNSTPEQPVHNHITEIGTSGIITVPYMPIGGNVVITSIPTVNIGNFPSNVSITSGNVVLGANATVFVNNFPTSYNGNVVVTSIPTVNIGNFPASVEISNDIGNPIPISGNVTATIAGTPSVNVTGYNLDAFARLRVSNPYTFFDSAISGERRYDWSSANTTGGTVTFDFNANVRKLNVTNASGSEVIRESIWCFPYQPGKSLLIMSSFCMSPSKTGLRQRVGYFGAKNGVYFEQTNGTKNMVIRSSSSGSLVEDRIPQADWNTDKLNGAGPSGLTMDTTATQIFWCDIEWLGVGTVRTGFVIDGKFITCHTFNHANNPTYTTTYMGTATLPCRYEITNTGATTGSSTLQQICTTIISEGGYIASTTINAAGTGVVPTRITTAGTYYPLVSIRLNSTHLDSIVKLAQIDILSPSINYYRWVVLKNATLTGATWTSASATVRVDVDTGATALSGGTEIESGFASSRETVSNRLSAIYGQLSRTLGDVSDTFTVAITSVSNNADVLGQIGWTEIL